MKTWLADPDGGAAWVMSWTVTVNSTLDITARADPVEVDTTIRCTSERLFGQM